MRKRITFFAVALVLWALGCTTPSPRADEAPAPDTPSVFTTTEAALPMPAQTLAVIRWEPDQARAFLRLVDVALSMAHPTNPLGWKLTQRPRLWQAENIYDALEDLFDVHGLDRSRSMIAAISSRGNEDYLRAKEFRIPSFSPQAYRGYSLRVFLPAAELSALRDEVERMAQAEASPFRRIDAFQDYLIIDVDFFPPRLSEDGGYEFVDLDYSGEDPNFWDRQTPAQADFLEHDPVLGIYLKIADLAPMIALTRYGYVGMGPIQRFALLMDDPDVREVEDLSFFIDEDEGGNLNARLVRTFTPHGSTLAHAQEGAPELPLHGAADPLLELAWSRPASMEDVRLPSWSQDPEDEDLGTLRNFLGASSQEYLPQQFDLAGLILAHGSHSRTYQAVLESDHSGLLAMAASLGWDEGWRGEISVLFDDDALTDSMRTNLSRLPGALGLEDLDVTEETTEEGTLRRLRFGSSEEGSADQAPPGGHLRVDLQPARLAAALPPSFGETFFHLDALIEFISDFEEGELTHHHDETLSITELRLGTRELSPPTLVDGFELQDPQVASSCRRALREISAELLRRYRAPGVDLALLEPLDEPPGDCDPDRPEDRQNLDFVRAHWSLAHGQALMGRHPEQALPVFEQACALEAEYSCQVATFLADYIDARSPLSLASVRFHVASPDGPLPLADHQGLYLFSAPQWASLQDLPPADAVGPRLPVALVLPPEESPVPITTVVIAAETPAWTAAHLVASGLHRGTSELIPEILEASGFQPDPRVLQAKPQTGFVVHDEESTSESSDSLPVLVMGHPHHLEDLDVHPVEIELGEDLSELLDRLDTTEFESPPAFLVTPNQDATFRDLAVLHGELDRWYAKAHGGVMPFVLVVP